MALVLPGILAVTYVIGPEVFKRIYNSDQPSNALTTLLFGESDSTALTTTSDDDSKQVVAASSIINAKSIRQTWIGNYLQSVNTSGTIIETLQNLAGLKGVDPISLLDVSYMAAGSAGFYTLFFAGVTPIAIITSFGLVTYAAVGMSEPGQAKKIGIGIGATFVGAASPGTASAAAGAAYTAAKETVKETVELAKSGVGLTTAALGLGTSVVVASAYVANKKRKHS